MIELTIPGYKTLQIAHLVMDYNGTIAVDGELVAGVEERLAVLGDQMTLHVVTADTFGQVGRALSGIDCELYILPKGNQDIGKLEYVKRIGAGQCVCVGNGRNDGLMLKAAALGLAVVLAEGAAVQTLVSADIVCTSIVSALDLLIHPLRLKATLRS